MYGTPLMALGAKLNKILFHRLVTSIDTSWNFVFQHNCHGTESGFCNISMNWFLILA